MADDSQRQHDPRPFRQNIVMPDEQKTYQPTGHLLDPAKIVAPNQPASAVQPAPQPSSTQPPVQSTSEGAGTNEGNG